MTRKHLLAYAFNGAVKKSAFPDTFDLVFTVGVLVRIHPDNLLSVMKKTYNYSNKYILSGEYSNRTPTMIEYQGQQDKLFKPDFGKLFVENFPLRLVNNNFLCG